MGFAPLAPSAARLVDPLGSPVIVYKRHEPGTHYFGCGERTGGLDKTQSRQVFWNFDPPSQHTAALNNMYTSIPFVLALLVVPLFPIHRLMGIANQRNSLILVIGIAVAVTSIPRQFGMIFTPL